MTEKSIQKYYKVNELVGGGMELGKAIRQCVMSPSTYYAVKKQLSDQDKQAPIVIKYEAAPKKQPTIKRTIKTDRPIIIAYVSQLKEILEQL